VLRRLGRTDEAAALLARLRAAMPEDAELAVVEARPAAAVG
jgi:hypothetical protein